MVIFTSKRQSVKLLDRIFALHELLLGKGLLAQVTDLLSLTEKGLTQGQLTWPGPSRFHATIMQQQCTIEYIILEMP